MLINYNALVQKFAENMLEMAHTLTWSTAGDHWINLWDSNVRLLRLLTKDDWLTRGDNGLYHNVAKQ